MDIKIFHSNHGPIWSSLPKLGVKNHLINLAKPLWYRCLHLCLLENSNRYLGLSQQRKKIHWIFVWRD